MESVKKRITVMKRIRWAGLPMGLLMYTGTEQAFGTVMATVLAVIAAVAFFFICDGEGRRTMCQYVADDLKAAVTDAGLNRCIVEIKSINAGLITRIYLIKAGPLAIRCNRAVLERINRSWYRKSIWVTQILELESEGELEEAQAFLDDALFDDLKRIRGEKWDSQNEKKDQDETDKMNGRDGKGK